MISDALALQAALERNLQRYGLELNQAEPDWSQRQADTPVERALHSAAAENHSA